jgi:hypothetical protein
MMLMLVSVFVRQEVRLVDYTRWMRRIGMVILGQVIIWRMWRRLEMMLLHMWVLMWMWIRRDERQIVRCLRSTSLLLLPGRLVQSTHLDLLLMVQISRIPELGLLHLCKRAWETCQ